MAVLLYVLLGLLGLAVGSFLNVVIHRLPRGESLSRPPSHCPACGAAIRARHNVPLLGWLVLRGRCADCGAAIGVRYPAVELATGLLFVALAARLHRLQLLAALPAYLYFAAIGIALAVIDIDLKRLPNRIVLPSYPVLAVLLAGAAAADGDGWRLARAGLAAAALFGFFLALAFAYPAGMGFGDVKLAGLLGLVLGFLSWSAVLVGTFAGFLLGALIGIAVLASRRGNRKTAVPFGPFLIAGALVAIFAGNTLAGWYPVG
ncbi:MAG TPA: prepilin peptidase [Jatrophihabitans sp.]|nr:prepilin peptidase [Jatrophihabitans sp.]